MNKDNIFYIVEKDNWYRLHIKDTHYCISGCPTLDPLLKTIRRLITKYKSGAKILSVLAHQEDKGRVGEKVFNTYQQEYELYSGDYDDLVEEVVSESMKKVKENTPFKRAQRLLKKVKVSSDENTTTGTTTTINHSEEKEEVNKRVVLKRPKLLRRV